MPRMWSALKITPRLPLCYTGGCGGGCGNYDRLGQVTHDTFELWPAGVPVTFLGYSAGVAVHTGHVNARRNDPTSPCDHAYKLFCTRLPGWCVHGRASWDPQLLLYAVRGDTHQNYVEQRGEISIDTATGQTSWIPCGDVTGPSCCGCAQTRLLWQGDKDGRKNALENELNTLYVQMPGQGLHPPPSALPLGASFPPMPRHPPQAPPGPPHLASWPAPPTKPPSTPTQLPGYMLSTVSEFIIEFPTPIQQMHPTTTFIGLTMISAVALLGVIRVIIRKPSWSIAPAAPAVSMGSAEDEVHVDSSDSRCGAPEGCEEEQVPPPDIAHSMLPP